jgi:hypothetical protein
MRKGILHWLVGLSIAGFLMGFLYTWYLHFGRLHPERIAVSFEATQGTYKLYGRIGKGRYVCWVSFEERLQVARTNRSADLKRPSVDGITVLLGDSVLGSTDSGRIAFDVPISSYDWIEVSVVLQTNSFVHLAMEVEAFEK